MTTGRGKVPTSHDAMPRSSASSWVWATSTTLGSSRPWPGSWPAPTASRGEGLQDPGAAPELEAGGVLSVHRQDEDEGHELDHQRDHLAHTHTLGGARRTRAPPLRRSYLLG